MGDEIIFVDGLWKSYGFRMPEWFYQHGVIFNKRIISETSEQVKRYSRYKWALQDISFKIKRGESYGVLGRNGSGKSTLLKILAGICPPTYGKVEVRGSVFPMIELNAGIHPDLNGWENIYLLGSIMGLSRRQVKKLLPAIEDFSELGDWLDKPVRMYSSGMLVRLGFSLAVHIDADILLFDEILAVGDLAFRKKCLDEIYRKITDQGSTVLLVTHDPYQVDRLCDYALLLDQGRIYALTEANQVLATYHNLMGNYTAQSALSTQKPESGENLRPGTGEIRVNRVCLLGQNGKEKSLFHCFEEMNIQIDLRVNKPVVDPSIRIDVTSVDNIIVTSISIHHENLTGVFTKEGEYRLICKVPQVLLMNGSYYLFIKISRGYPIDSIDNMAPFHVELPNTSEIRSISNKGLFVTKANWEISREGMMIEKSD